MLVSLEQVMHLVSVLDSAKICAGNNEEKYVESVKSSETTLAGTTGKVMPMKAHALISLISFGM